MQREGQHVAAARRSTRKSVSAAVTPGRLRAATDPVLTQQVTPDKPLWNQFGTIGGALGPARVSSIIRAADSGRPAQFVDLTHEARQKDGHFQCIMQARELALACLPWSLQRPEDATPQEEQAADACETSIRSCQSFPTMLAHLDGESLLFGFARSETIWKIGDAEDDPKLRGLLIHSEFKNLSCRRFGFSTSTGKLLFDAGGHGNVDVGGVDLFEDYPRGKFVGIERRINGDVLCREGLARVLVWAALFRNWTVRDWLALAELAWKPLRTGKFNKETVSHEDVTALQSILERLTTRGWAAIPKSVDLDIHFPKGTSDTGQGNHQLLCEYLGQGMSKAVIGGTLTVEAGNRGARSLGEVQERVKRELRDADALSEMPSVQRYLVEPFYRLNYGESLRPSTFVFQTEDALDTLKLAQTIKTLVEAGDPSIPIAWGHDQAGIPVAADDEPVFGAYSIPDEDSEDADDAQGKAAGRDTDHD